MSTVDDSGWVDSHVLAYGPDETGTRSLREAGVRWGVVQQQYQAWALPPLPDVAAQAPSLFDAVFGLRHQLQHRGEGWVLLIAGARRDAWWPGVECASTHVWIYPDGHTPQYQVHALNYEDEVQALALQVQQQVQHHHARRRGAGQPG